MNEATDTDLDAAALFDSALWSIEHYALMARQHAGAGDIAAAAYCLRAAEAHLVTAAGVLKSIHDKRAKAHC